MHQLQRHTGPEGPLVFLNLGQFVPQVELGAGLGGAFPSPAGPWTQQQLVLRPWATQGQDARVPAQGAPLAAAPGRQEAQANNQLSKAPVERQQRAGDPSEVVVSWILIELVPSPPALPLVAPPPAKKPM